MSNRRIGNYQITEYIGGGGFGSVFKAEDCNNRARTVAIKELHKKHTRNPVIKQRFFQEAVAMARLDHRNLPRLFTFGEDNGCYYLVMEFLQGKLLGDEINDSGSVESARAILIVSQVLEALSYAHKNGIIHRDLKPDNIMLLDQEGALRVKVLDFGIARMIGGESLTQTGEGFGTPAYMSPERMTGTLGDDPRIDIYSTGIILYEMLTGKCPFESMQTDPAAYWMEMRSMHESRPLPSLTSLGFPQTIDEIVMRAAAKRVEDRYSSADDMVADLERRGVVQCAPTEVLSSARLGITTMPPAATIFVDDLPRGASDEAGKALIDGLSGGLHSVRVSKDGYNDYRISVALECGHQTDLQVALAARSTVVASPAPQTAVGGFETARFQGADEVKTALVVINSLPVGTNVFIGNQSVGSAGEDGKATLRLLPGDHEIRVATPAGLKATRKITLTNKDTGSQQVMTMPLDRATSQPPQTVQPGTITASRSGKRWASIGAVVLLLALAASAAYVFVFQRSRPQTQLASSTANEPAPTSAEHSAKKEALPEPAPSASAATPDPSQKSDNANQDELKKALAEKERLEKKLAEEQKRAADQSKGQTDPPQKPDAPPAVIPQVPPPAEPQEEGVPGPGEACLTVTVSGPAGQPATQLRVVLVPQGDNSRMLNARTNFKGRVNRCGLTPGKTMRVAVFGPRGAILGNKSTELRPGRNFLDITVVTPAVNRNPDGTRDEPPDSPNRKRHPFKY